MIYVKFQHSDIRGEGRSSYAHPNLRIINIFSFILNNYYGLN